MGSTLWCTPNINNITRLCSSRVLLTSVVSKCPHTSTRCSSEQRPSTGVWMHSIDTNLHVTRLCLVLPDYASWHTRKQTMFWFIPPCWRRRLPHAIHVTMTTNAPGRNRLQSRHSFSVQAKQPPSDAHGKTNMAWTEGTWATRWDTTPCRLRQFNHNPSNTPV